MIITATIALAVVVAGSIALNMINRGRREAQRTMAREQAAHRELNALAEALARFRGDVERYPTNEEGLRCLARKPAAFEAAGAGRSSYWFGPYLENVPEVDPWGNDYVIARRMAAAASSCILLVPAVKQALTASFALRPPTN